MAPNPKRDKALKIEDLDANGVGIRSYQKKKVSDVPTLLFFHGGGFVVGDLETLDDFCKEIAYRADVRVVSSNYPLAPEHPFPEGVESAYETAVWVYENLDVNHLTVGGSSAGANIAAVVCAMAWVRKGPPIESQILLCPCTDFHMIEPSCQEMAEGYNLTLEQMQWFRGKYMASEEQWDHPYASPLLAKNLSGLPRALVVTAQLDPLCDQGRLYAQRLKDAGVESVDSYYEGMVHGFMTIAPDTAAKEKCLNEIADWLTVEVPVQA